MVPPSFLFNNLFENGPILFQYLYLLITIFPINFIPVVERQTWP